MGYQESYVTAPDFASLVEITKKLGQKFFDDRLVEPVLIITLNEDITVRNKKIKAGTKFLYFSGERHYQRMVALLYDCSQPEGTRRWFTEDFPSEAIFAERSKVATLESFKI